MGQQAIRQHARRTAREVADKRRRERAERERRVMDLAEQVMVAIGERDAATVEWERRAARALRALTHGEGLTLSDAVAWCGEAVTVREARRIRDLPETDPPTSADPETGPRAVHAPAPATGTGDAVASRSTAAGPGGVR